MKFKNFTIQEQTGYCARWLLIHSIAYYELDVNMVSDSNYDTKLKWLCKYSEKYKDEIDNCYYYDLIHNLDPCSGFYMKNYITQEHYEYLLHITRHIYRRYLAQSEKGRK